MKNALSAASDAATSAIEGAQAELDRVRGVLDVANSALSAGQNELNDAQSAFDAAVAEVYRLTYAVNTICFMQNCLSGKCSYTI